MNIPPPCRITGRLCWKPLLPLLMLVTLFGCAGRKPTPVASPSPAINEAPAGQDPASAVWQRFATRATTAESMSGPFRVSGTLRYSTPKGESTRASSLLWGNGKAGDPYPLRMDLMAGVGSVVAKVREDGKSFSAFIPDENTVYTRSDGSKTLASFGVPIPLSLGDLTLILTGRAGKLFLPLLQHSDPGVPEERAVTAEGARFTIPNAALPGVLEISKTGVPLNWAEAGGGWSIVFESGGLNPLQPEKLRISHPSGYSALIVVKEITRVSPPYTQAQLDLTLPPGTFVKPLADPETGAAVAKNSGDVPTPSASRQRDPDTLAPAAATRKAPRAGTDTGAAAASRKKANPPSTASNRKVQSKTAVPKGTNPDKPGTPQKQNPPKPGTPQKQSPANTPGS